MTTETAEFAGTLETENPLWHFALAFWQQPEVEQTCLALQSRGWSVTRILCACWQASRNRSYPTQEAPEIVRWRNDITATLRTIRHILPKEQYTLAALRDNVAAAELHAEQIELALAFRALSTKGPTEAEHQDLAGLTICNLRQAAPEPMIDRETGILLEQLTRSLRDRLSPTGASKP